MPLGYLQKFSGPVRPKNRLVKLEKLGHPLVRLDRDAFKPLLKNIHQKPRKSNVGRKPWEPMLQTLCNLSDDQTEFQGISMFRDALKPGVLILLK